LTLVFAASSAIYLVGRHLSSKSAETREGRASYACGEKASFRGLRINVSLYKYLIYFVVLDASVLLVAFAALVLSTIDALLFMFYLFIMVVSSFLLVGGGDQ
jgi:NADH:ubiquinone oxidoreductase subunit 3 (subunit A)